MHDLFVMPYSYKSRSEPFQYYRDGKEANKMLIACISGEWEHEGQTLTLREKYVLMEFGKGKYSLAAMKLVARLDPKWVPNTMGALERPSSVMMEVVSLRMTVVRPHPEAPALGTNRD